MGFYDIDFKKAKLASEKWDCKAYKNINDLFIDLPEVIIICVPNSNIEVFLSLQYIS